MDKEDIHLKDVHRILFGEAPPVFLIEVFVRTLLMFGFCLVVVKLLGKRMNGKMSVTEMTVMIMIGALISVPMQFPDRGIFQGLVLLAGMLVLYNVINLLAVRYKAAEKLLQGEAKALIKDSRLLLDEMQAVHISKQQIFEQLRSRQIYNLGEVKRFYLEACGAFSIYKQETARPGLLILPAGEDLYALRLAEKDPEKICCSNCGFTRHETQSARACQYCKSNRWQQAAKTRLKHEQ